MVRRTRAERADGTDVSDYAAAVRVHDRQALQAHWEFQLRAVGIDPPAREHRFHPTRNWRFDYAWPDLQLAVELQGFGHHQLNRYFSDVEKFNAAMLAGWHIYLVTTAMVHNGTGLALVEQALEQAKSYYHP